MQNDEKEIIDYLKRWPNSFVSGKEIARKVGGKERFDRDHGWAIPIFAQMVRLGIIETDQLGHFRLKPEVKKKQPRHEHVSPQILKILKSSGKSFEGVSIEDDPKESDKPPIPFYPKPDKSPAAAKADKD
jgi:hypothetical protein